jgi:hypothetical protein
MDPSPFREKDLDPKAEEFIVDSLKELSPRAPNKILIHLDQPTGLPEEDRVVGDAVRIHFARRARLLRRDRHLLCRRGAVSLAIGAAFLVVVFGLSQFVSRFGGESAVARLFREGLLIVGWVAMWRPLEIFLYDWWPILGDERIYDRLSQIPVRIVSDGHADPDCLAQLLAGKNAQPSAPEFDRRAAARAIARWENEGGAIKDLPVEAPSPGAD